VKCETGRKVTTNVEENHCGVKTMNPRQEMKGTFKGSPTRAEGKLQSGTKKEGMGMWEREGGKK